MTDVKKTQSMKPFFTIWTGQALSLIGTRVAQFAVVWWLTELTGSATVLAIASLMAMLPMIVLGPVAGAYVDRWNRRKILIVADSLAAIIAIGLAWLYWQGNVQIWQVYLLLFVRATGEAFHFPAMQASTTLMVPKKHFARIAGINQALQGGLTVIAPPLGALFLAFVPIYTIMGFDVITALFAIVPLLFIHIPQPAPDKAKIGEKDKQSSVWRDLKEGFEYVKSWPGLAMIMVLAALINFILTPAFSLLPLLVTDHFNGEAFHLGFLEATWGVGVVLGGIFLGVWGGFKRQIHTTLIGLAVGGISIALLGVAPAQAFWVALIALLFAGLTNPLINGPIMAIIQGTVAPQKQGRVFTLLTSVSMAMVPLSLLLAGPIADYTGVRVWYVAGGVVCSLIGLTGFLIPAVLYIEDHQAEVDESVALTTSALNTAEPVS